MCSKNDRSKTGQDQGRSDEPLVVTDNGMWFGKTFETITYLINNNVISIVFDTQTKNNN